MAATSTLVRHENPMEIRERGAVTGFLAGYSGNTRVSYATDLRLFAAWWAASLSACSRCAALSWRCSPGRWNSEDGCARWWRAACRRCAVSTATATWKGSSPGTRPPTCVDPRSTPSPARWAWTGTSWAPCRSGLGPARDHALISLLAMCGLRISEALGANIDDVEVDRGHRTLRVVRKGAKQVTIPLAPRPTRALDLYTLDLYIGERVTARSSWARLVVGWIATPPTGP
jgi:integrase/recombinase XerD